MLKRNIKRENDDKTPDVNYKDEQVTSCSAFTGVVVVEQNLALTMIMELVTHHQKKTIRDAKLGKEFIKS